MNQILKTARRIAKNVKMGIWRSYFRSKSTYHSLVGYKVECNLCHYKADRFESGYWHKYSGCPCCYNGVRTRLVWAALTELEDVNKAKLIRNKKVLHLAPEMVLSDLLRNEAAVYKKADFLAEGYAYPGLDYNLDMSDMRSIKDGEFDCLVALDVLEHVPDHMRALRETYRILSPGGWCILTVPQKDHLKNTIEDPSIDTPEKREEHYGQADHVRVYGDDFPDMLSSCGFEVTVVDERRFDPAFVAKHVLFPPVLSEHPLATNYRKVFFGHKK